MPQGLDPIAWIVIGFLAGAVAGWFVPNRARMGCLGTTALGIVGGLVGGWAWTTLLNQDSAGGFLGALLIAILGAAFVLVLVRGLTRD
ncbi:MAG TPA: GlsB/YeaQ/YmgE family stress response membrane protein [Candidatus Limnocylindria bacterium]|nr:GlsB/YeaQ/YmgE family stress response membrane protein [Candidatus Limnocylindria bacterium]